MNNMKLILQIVICLFIGFFGLFMTLGSRNKTILVSNDQEYRESEEKTEDESKAEDEEKNETEEEPEAQIYGFDSLNAYFTNMEEIQENDEFLPYRAYSDLVQKTNDFLEEQTEVSLPESGNIELSLTPGMTYKKNNLICFHCFFVSFDTDLEIEYVYDDTLYEYTDIHFVKKGEWDIPWKK